MFEIHGWGVFVSDIVTEDVAVMDRDSDKMLAELRARIRGADEYYRSFFHIPEPLNGMRSFTVSGLMNHRRDFIFDIFEWFASRSRWNHGLLYVGDDEDHTRGADYQNVFRVWCVARGRLDERDDPFLSPRIPTVENPFGVPPEWEPTL